MLAFVIEHRLRSRGLGVAWISVALIIVFLQPQGGEVFFSITNTQWLLGLTLAIYLCLPEPDPGSRLELAALALVCLTGPFSLLLLPVLGLQLLVRRDWQSRWKTYAIVAIAASVQLLVLLNSNRLQSKPPSPDDLGNWLLAGFNFLKFGGVNRTVVVAAMAFWVLLIFGLGRYALPRFRAAKRDGDAVYPLARLPDDLCCELVLGVPVEQCHEHQSAGRRLTLFLYPVWAALYGCRGSVRSRPALIALLSASAAIICIASLHRDPRENMQWPAYARFAMARPGLVIPINPVWSFLPTWQVIPPPGLPITEVPSHAAAFQPVSTTDSAGVEFSTETMCSASKFIGIEVNASRAAPGLVALEWGPGRHWQLG